MNKIYIILFLLFTNVLMASVFYFRDVSINSQTPITGEMDLDGQIIDLDGQTEVIFATGALAEILVIDENSLSLEAALKIDRHIYDTFHLVDPSSDINVYEDFYNAFTALETFEEYKVFTEKYPALLVSIYAAKNRDKENYLKFYNFIFSMVLEENIPRSIQDLKDIGGEELNGEELREPFINFVGGQYEIISSGTNSLTSDLGQGPISVALTGDNLKVANNNCDIGEITSQDSLTLQECYNYVLHYRATDENNYCDLLFGEYDTAICKSYLSSRRN